MADERFGPDGEKGEVQPEGKDPGCGSERGESERDDCGADEREGHEQEYEPKMAQGQTSWQSR